MSDLLTINGLEVKVYERTYFRHYDTLAARWHTRSGYFWRCRCWPKSRTGEGPFETPERAAASARYELGG